MKSSFTGFYSSSNQELREIWNDPHTLFVFDTNCLLNLYRCEEQTREDILNVMRVISERTWIPFQVGFEFQRNRRKVIEESIDSLNKIKAQLENIYTQNILSHGSVKKHLYNALSDEVSDLQLNLKTPIDEFINNNISTRINNKLEITKHDHIRVSIDDIILDNVGTPPSQESIDGVNKLGEDRYKKKIPPGFKDDTKKSNSYFGGVEFQDKYGDLYLWKEIIDKANSEQINNVIFICDDNKSDWWFIIEGKTHGALEALKTEICKDANIESFKLVSQSTFLHEAKDYLLDIQISESSLKEVENLSQLGPDIKQEDKFHLYEHSSNVIIKNNKYNNSYFKYTTPQQYLSDEINEDLNLDIKSNIKNAEMVLGKAHHNIIKAHSRLDKLHECYEQSLYEGLEELLFENRKKIKSSIKEVENNINIVHSYISHFRNGMDIHPNIFPEVIYELSESISALSISINSADNFIRSLGL